MMRHLHQQAGGVFPAEHAPPDASGAVVLHYGDPRGEYRAARETCAVFDLSGRTQMELTGDDRAKFLNNFCTNDIKRLAPGQGCEAFV
ncbi:MAG: hypothetical protein ACREJB_01600, partial [Planctomycetaceae bacterium]